MTNAIIDYGAGNLCSVQNAISRLGKDSIITANPSEIMSADRVILPGVGAFGDAMRSLAKKGLDKVISDYIKSERPFLGICLGLQLLFEESEESPGVSGLGIIKGRVVHIPPRKGLKIPHMGWNNIELSKKSDILRDLGERPYVYFVHSYYIQASDESDVSAYTEYGESLGAAIERGNVYATQFHPEKSGKTGLKILKNFLEL